MRNEKKRDIFEGAILAKDYFKSTNVKPRKKRLADVVKSHNPEIVVWVPEEMRRIVHESVIQKEIKNYMKSIGIWCHKAKATNLVGEGKLVPTDKGIPDILGCLAGEFIAVEAKNATGEAKVSADQMTVMGWIRQCGGHAFVAYSVHCVRRYLARWCQDKNVRLTWPIVAKKGEKRE